MSQDELVITVETEEVTVSVEKPEDVSVILDPEHDLFVIASSNFGPRGPQGPVGPSGAKGEKGDQGVIGPEGPQGIEGPVGPEGPQGATGTGITMCGSVPTQGDLPTTAEQGDAYIVQSDDSLWIYDGGEWVSGGSIQGPPGPTGPQGAQGPTGAQGPAGPEGPEGQADVPDRLAGVAQLITDWDLALENGWYCANSPGGYSRPIELDAHNILGRVEVFDSGFITQTVWPSDVLADGSHPSFVRYSLDGVWGDWHPASAIDLEYLGEYIADTQYSDGDIVVVDGVPYLCVRPTNEPPVPWQTESGIIGPVGPPGAAGLPGPFRLGHTWTVPGPVGAGLTLPPFFVPKLTTQSVEAVQFIAMASGGGNCIVYIDLNGVNKTSFYLDTATAMPLIWNNNFVIANGDRISGRFANFVGLIQDLSVTVVLEHRTTP